MSVPDRQAELLRQRALLREHLAWLDREIAAEQSQRTRGAATDAASATDNAGDENESPGGLAYAAPADAPGAAAPAPVEVEAAADTILADYRTPSSKLQQDVRLGCFLYFSAALVAVAAGVVALYFLLRHR